MATIYGALLVLGLIMFADSIRALVESLELHYYWLTVGLGLLSLFVIQVVRYKKGYKIDRPFTFVSSVFAAIVGYPLTIIATHTRAEFSQFEYGNELIILGLTITFAMLCFAGKREDSSTSWGSDNRSDLSKRIDER